MRRTVMLPAFAVLLTGLLAHAQTPTPKPANPTQGKPVAPPVVDPGQGGKIGTAPLPATPAQPATPSSTPSPLPASNPAKYDSATTDPGTTGAAAPDAARLEGLWQAVAIEAGGKPAADSEVKSFRVRFHGNQVVMNPGAHEQAHGFTLDPKADPKAFDLIPLDGPAKGRPAPAGIYKLDGDTLTACMNKGTGGKRPTAFKTTADDDNKLITFERVKVK